MVQTILLVDDEIRMLELLELFLIPKGYKCLKSQNGKEALRMITDKEVSLVILDVMMPVMDGWETCKEIRKLSVVPILMLTARTDKSDVVKGLNVGADDYLTKPFDDSELLARVSALLRRIPIEKVEQTIIKRDEYELDTNSYSLHFYEKRVLLTMKEFKIIEVLIKNPKRTYTREQLLLVAWDYIHPQTFEQSTPIYAIYVKNLRNQDFPLTNF